MLTEALQHFLHGTLSQSILVQETEISGVEVGILEGGVLHLPVLTPLPKPFSLHNFIVSTCWTATHHIRPTGIVTSQKPPNCHRGCLPSLDHREFCNILPFTRGFPGGSVVKNPPVKARDMGLIPGLGRSPGKGNGNPLQYSCLEIPWQRSLEGYTVHGVAKRRTWLSDWAHTHLVWEPPTFASSF